MESIPETVNETITAVVDHPSVQALADKLGIGVGIVVAASSLSEIITKIANPEYWAIKEAAELLGLAR